MLNLIDTHTHLNLDEYAEDQQNVIQTALAAGLTRMLIPGVTLEGCLSAIPLCEQHPGVIFFALGVHPTDVSKGSGWSADVSSRFRELATHPACVAIGETGLDYYWDESAPADQHRALREQIQLAQSLQLPVILHVRDKKDSTAAYDDLIRILREEQAQTFGGVMHCFSGDQSFADAALDLNFYLAFGGVLTFKNAPVQQQVAQNVPLERILLETDSPYLAPVPFRGKRNEPAYVRYVADKLAELRRLSVAEVADITTANAHKLFKF